MRLAELEARIDADLACGRQLEVVGELEALVSRNPLRERLRFMLMLALYRSGRQADALAAYQDARRALTDELGLELSAELKDLERRILAHDPALDLPALPLDAERGSQPKKPHKRRRRILVAVATLLALGGISAVGVEHSAGSSTRSLVAPCNNLNACAHQPQGAGSLAIGFGSLWFDAGNRTVDKIDLRSRRVAARIQGAGNVPTLGGIVIGAGSVWVAGPYQETPLIRIDPATNRIVARIPFLKDRSSGIAFGANAVWVSDAANNQVWEIDPSTNTPVGTTKVGEGPEGVAYGDGSIWVANAGDGTVSRIDPTTGKVVRTITVGGSPNRIAVTTNRIWVTVD